MVFLAYARIDIMIFQNLIFKLKTVSVKILKINFDSSTIVFRRGDSHPEILEAVKGQ